ncbi:MAG: restriction endonuclease subunit S [Phycisphaerales bacterium]|nr:restriction endonuclease subunit S [Phycisphaerales bacterium]
MIEPPTHWKSKPLAELCDVVIGRTPARANPLFWGDGHRWLSIADMKDREIAETSESITDAAVAECGCREVQPGTVVMSFKLSVGKVGIVRTPMFTNEAIAALPILKPDCIDPTFLFYALQVADLGVKDRAAKGLTLNKPKLEKIKVAFPPLAEQKRIAAILDKADAIRRRRQEAARLADTLIPSVFYEMFGDPVTNRKKWPVRLFGEVCDSRLGKMLDAKQQTGEYARPYLRNLNVQWGRLDMSTVFTMDFDPSDREEFRLRTGDVMICEGGAGVGQTAIWRDELPECYFQKSLHRVRPHASLAGPEYIAHLMWVLMKSGSIMGVISSATIPHLTGIKLKTIPIPVPPVALQREFGKRVKATRELQTVQGSVAHDADALFNALVQRAFRGEL